jgi:hypothetical protein
MLEDAFSQHLRGRLDQYYGEGEKDDSKFEDDHKLPRGTLALLKRGQEVPGLNGVLAKLDKAFKTQDGYWKAAWERWHGKKFAEEFPGAATEEQPEEEEKPSIADGLFKCPECEKVFLTEKYLLNPACPICQTGCDPEKDKATTEDVAYLLMIANQELRGMRTLALKKRGMVTADEMTGLELLEFAFFDHDSDMQAAREKVKKFFDLNDLETNNLSNSASMVVDKLLNEVQKGRERTGEFEFNTKQQAHRLFIVANAAEDMAIAAKYCKRARSANVIRLLSMAVRHEALLRLKEPGVQFKIVKKIE